MYCNNKEMNLREYLTYQIKTMPTIPEWRLNETHCFIILDYLSSMGEFSKEDEQTLTELGYTAAEFTEDYN